MRDGAGDAVAPGGRPVIGRAMTRGVYLMQVVGCLQMGYYGWRPGWDGWSGEVGATWGWGSPGYGLTRGIVERDVA